MVGGVSWTTWMGYHSRNVKNNVNGFKLKNNLVGWHQSATATGHFQSRPRSKILSTCILRRMKLRPDRRVLTSVSFLWFCCVSWSRFFSWLSSLYWTESSDSAAWMQRICTSNSLSFFLSVCFSKRSDVLYYTLSFLTMCKCKSCQQRKPHQF